MKETAKKQEKINANIGFATMLLLCSMKTNLSVFLKETESFIKGEVVISRRLDIAKTVTGSVRPCQGVCKVWREVQPSKSDAMNWKVIIPIVVIAAEVIKAIANSKKG